MFTLSSTPGSAAGRSGVISCPAGRFRAAFRGNRLCSLHWLGQGEGASDLREPFLAWLEAFAPLAPAAQWRLLDPGGTAFQRRVWRALLEVPPGQPVRYGYLAHTIGRPEAARAVGGAVAANPVALLIPCHRVVPCGGGPGGYRWGSHRKEALLAAESAPGFTLYDHFA